MIDVSHVGLLTKILTDRASSPFWQFVVHHRPMMRAPAPLLSSIGFSTFGAVHALDDDADEWRHLRDQLCGLQGLLVLSMLMTENDDESRTLQLATTAVPSLGDCRLAGAYLIDRGWHTASGSVEDEAVRAELEAQFAVLSSAGGPVAITHQPWAWAFPLRSLYGQFGYLVVEADDEPRDAVQYLLRVLAQQTAIALSNNRLHARERESVVKLREDNAALANTVSALERSRAIHDRLDMGVAAGEGQMGIARAVHELTGRAVVVEDRHGNVQAWAGDEGEAKPVPKRAEPPDREQLLQQADQAGRPLRDGDRWVSIARPRHDLVGVLSLVDPEGETGEEEQIALTHGATLLAMELVRLQSIAETEFRLGRDLVDELLSGADEADVLAAAQALGFDVARPHCVLVIEAEGVEHHDTELIDSVRLVTREARISPLLAPRGRTVVMIAEADGPWTEVCAGIARHLNGRRGHVGVGGPCIGLSGFSRSLREAQLAMHMQRTWDVTHGVTMYAELGVFQLFAEVEDVSGLERFSREWLSRLLEYDEAKHSELVITLSRYLECGRNLDATSRALSIHRSTLKYRLQRIGQISGHDLSDHDTTFNLELALRSWQALAALRD